MGSDAALGIDSGRMTRAAEVMRGRQEGVNETPKATLAPQAGLVLHCLYWKIPLS
jgi:hypothetical protein